MIDYYVQINGGIEAFGVDQKTITVKEDLRTIEVDALAREIAHMNNLIPEQVALSVLDNFCKAAVHLMDLGFAIQLRSGNNVAMRIYPDVKLKCGNINLAKAKEMMPDVIQTEEDMVAHASELVSKAGLVLKVHAESEIKFTELLNSMNITLNRKGIIERAKIMLTENSGGNTGGNTGGGGGDNGGGGGDENPDGVE